MELSAIYHSMDKRFCYALSKGKFLFRLQVKKDDIVAASLHYRDKYLPLHLNDTRRCIPMKKIASGTYHDYYEVETDVDVICLRYFFEITSYDGEKIYYGNYRFFDEPINDNGYMFDLPQNLREEECFDVPQWAKNSVVYQIFPSRFATTEDVPDDVWYKTPIHHTDNLKGNLKGLISKLDHIKELGADVVYMTPVFESDSSHKYDTNDYMIIDSSFGTKEDLKELVAKAHSLDMKVILDGVFNHTSTKFFAFKDVIEKGAASEYCDWYYIEDYPVVQTHEVKPNFKTFSYYYGMPKLNLSNPATREYFINVGKYWIEECDIDGWRLDVGDEISHDFWKAFRKAVKSVKSDCLIVGEIWHYAGDFLEGDEWDSVMNYHFQTCVADFINTKRLNASGFVGQMGWMRGNSHKEAYKALLNLIDSHDTTRFLHTCNNSKNKLRIAAALQLLMPGAAMIYYGDEVGLTGGADPDCRRGMLWDKEKQDLELFEYYKKLIQLRKEYPWITDGEISSVYTDDENDVILIKRETAHTKGAVIIHNNRKTCTLPSSVISDIAGNNCDIINLVNNSTFDGTLKPYDVIVIDIK